MNHKEYTDALRWRYACKKFDPSAQIEEELWDVIIESFRLAPSSLGLEPWHFIVVDSPQKRAELQVASYGQVQVRDASKYVVLCGLRTIEEEDLNAHVAQIREIRCTTSEQDAAALTKYRGYSAFWENGRHDAYIESQVHLAAGFVAAGAAFLEIDTCIIGGMQPSRYNEILGLEKTRYRAVLGMAFGKRSSEDSYADAPKVRFSRETIFSRQ